MNTIRVDRLLRRTSTRSISLVQSSTYRRTYYLTDGAESVALVLTEFSPSRSKHLDLWLYFFPDSSADVWAHEELRGVAQESVNLDAPFWGRPSGSGVTIRAYLLPSHNPVPLRRGRWVDGAQFLLRFDSASFKDLSNWLFQAEQCHPTTFW